MLQALALKLGVVAERDLAQCCRDAYPRWLNYCLWILSEVPLQPPCIASCSMASSLLQLGQLQLLPDTADC